MAHYRYVILGGGMAANAAAKGIREYDPDGSIAVISNDADEPYTRPALSKRLWTDEDFDESENYLGTGESTGAQIHLRTQAIEVDTDLATVRTSTGDFEYAKLLFATGGRPAQLDLEESRRVIYFRDFADYRRLREFAGRDLSVAVIGGGFIGTELAAALVQNRTHTTLIFDDEILGASVFPADLALSFHELYCSHGVDLVPETKISGGQIDDDQVLIDYGGGTHAFDAVVVGLGIDPATGLAKAAGLEVDDGIVVDEFLQTSAPNVFAAGDVASYPDKILGRQRVEHVDNATQMGTAAGRIMAGHKAAYTHTPYFYTNVFDFGYEAVGTLDSQLRTVEDWQKPNSEGAVYYLTGDGRIEGILLVNLDDQLGAAREILAEDWAHEPADLVGRLPQG